MHFGILIISAKHLCISSSDRCDATSVESDQMCPSSISLFVAYLQINEIFVETQRVIDLKPYYRHRFYLFYTKVARFIRFMSNK